MRLPSPRRAPRLGNVRLSVKLGLVAYTDATNGIPPPHSWSVNTYSASEPKAGAKAGSHVLVSGSSIVWLVGHRIAEGYSPGRGTKKVFCMSLQPDQDHHL